MSAAAAAAAAATLGGGPAATEKAIGKNVVPDKHVVVNYVLILRTFLIFIIITTIPCGLLRECGRRRNKINVYGQSGAMQLSCVSAAHQPHSGATEISIAGETGRCR